MINGSYHLLDIFYCWLWKWLNFTSYHKRMIMIRKPILLSSLLLIGLLQSCETGNNHLKQQDTVFTRSAFIAIDGKDTARLNLKTGNEIVEGKLVIKHYNKVNNDGFLRGSFKGDTLYADYSFRKGTNKVIYKNPLAFLRKDGKLILGVGTLENMFGRTYFRKDKPIEFDEGRFTFTPVADR
jgi:hypothetical protein